MKLEGDLEMEQVSWLQCHPGEVPQHITLSQLSLSNAQEGEWAEAARGTCKHQGKKNSSAHAWYLFAKPQLQMCAPKNLHSSLKWEKDMCVQEMGNM